MFEDVMFRRTWKVAVGKGEAVGFCAGYSSRRFDRCSSMQSQWRVLTMCLCRMNWISDIFPCLRLQHTILHPQVFIISRANLLLALILGP